VNDSAQPEGNSNSANGKSAEPKNGQFTVPGLTLLDARGGQPREIAMTAAYAFLVGYFSDGVSGLLSNIANAVFGTLEKK
jgi:hypothetical protein